MSKIPFVVAMAEQEIRYNGKYTGKHWRDKMREWLKTKDGKAYLNSGSFTKKGKQNGKI